MSDMVLKVIHDEQGYSFYLPSGGYGSVTKVDGKIVETGKSYTSDHLPKVEVYEKKRKQTIARSEIQDLPDISILEYEEKKNNLLSKSTYNGESRTWGNIEDKFEFERFLNHYQIETEYILVKQKEYELQMEEKIPNDNPFIIPFRHLGEEITVQKAKYDRKSFLISHIRKFLEDNKWTEVTDFTTKLGEFKIYDFRSGEISVYVDGKLFYSDTVKTITDTYEYVLKRYEEDRAMVEKMVASYVINTSRIPNMQDMVQILKTIRTKVKDIQFMKKSQEDYRNCLYYINAKIDEFENVEKKDQN